MGPGIIRPRRLSAWLRAVACALLAALALIPQQASAQSKTASANEAAIVLQPGTIVKLTDMSFGTIAGVGTAGTVVLPAQSPATCTTTGGLIHSGACQSASFAIRGKHNQHVRIRDAGNSGIVTLTGPGGATMTMDTMTTRVNGMIVNGNGQGWKFGNYLITDPSGNANFWVGGTLHVAATQAAGLYTGTLTIQIQFN